MLALRWTQAYCPIKPSWWLGMHGASGFYLDHCPGQAGRSTLAHSSNSQSEPRSTTTSVCLQLSAIGQATPCLLIDSLRWRPDNTAEARWNLQKHICHLSPTQHSHSLHFQSGLIATQLYRHPASKWPSLTYRDKGTKKEDKNGRLRKSLTSTSRPLLWLPHPLLSQSTRS